MSLLSFVTLICLATLIHLLKIRGELQNQNVWNGRKELRELDEITLSLLQHKFDQFQQESIYNVTLIDALAMAAMTKESIIERLEDSIGMMLPYWDYRIDAQLTKPEDSSIMLMELCRHSVNMKATNDSVLIQNVNDTESEIDRQLVKIEQRCRSGALLTFLRQTLPPNDTDGKGCSSCASESSKKWLFCDHNVHRCISKIIPNGNCTMFANDSESCFQSRCHQGRCNQQELANVMELSENITITKNPAINLENSEELKIFISPPETISLTKNFTSNINSNNTTGIDIQTVENNSILTESSSRVISESKYPVSKYTPHASSKFKDLGKYYWTNISSVENNSNLVYDKKEIILSEKHLNRNRKKFRKKYSEKSRNKGEVEINKIPIQKYPESIHFIQRDNSTFRTKKLLKCSHYHRKLKQHRRISNLSKSIVHSYGYDRSYPSEDLSEFLKSNPDSGKTSKFGMNDMKLSAKRETTDNKLCQFLLSTTAALNILSQYVYFSITVIKEKPKRNKLLNRAVVTCDITLTGANMPYGFTQKIKGQLVQGKTSAIIRTLNPEIFGPLVEFNIAVNDQHGQPCRQKCLNNKGSYGNCEDRPIRLTSHEFIAFSDPIEFYETQKLLLECQWTGRGYYRERKCDFLLFICDE
ncbi:unnamed protein product [Cercopithifilaria johnstoni]|uniref:Uncharacterized protein n=1 Tax=Cercopithifilaria johnstoni TaxID=2874296 RepID=A0A8J2MLH5_9BILA|nr:unnamed protein product [Cercopithifilaria johnstoni]